MTTESTFQIDILLLVWLNFVSRNIIFFVQIELIVKTIAVLIDNEKKKTLWVIFKALAKNCLTPRANSPIPVSNTIFYQ